MVNSFCVALHCAAGGAVPGLAHHVQPHHLQLTAQHQDQVLRRQVEATDRGGGQRGGQGGQEGRGAGYVQMDRDVL